MQGESTPVLVKESHIQTQTYSRPSVCGPTYLSVVTEKTVRLKKKKKKKKKVPTYPI